MSIPPHPDNVAPGSPDAAPDASRPGWAGCEPGNQWTLAYVGYDPAAEGLREVLCAVGNGYWATRGAAPEADADEVHYPGTYLAGVYNRVRTERDGHPVEDEHMVNAPNWLPLWFRVADGGWFHPATATLLDYRQSLDLRRGLLTRVIRFRDDAGRTTKVTTRRFVSHASPHIAVLDTTFEAEDWAGLITVMSALDGRVANRNVATDRPLAGSHLAPRHAVELNGETVLLEMETTQSGIHVAMGARTRTFDTDRVLSANRRFLSDDAGWAAHEFALHVEKGHPVRVEKTVAVFTSRDRAIASPAHAVGTALLRAGDAAGLLAAHEREWQILWDEFAVTLVPGGKQLLALNLNTFHVLQTVAAVDVDLDAGVPARGLHGEGYR
ncbi:MAG TPA: family 65 glycosyl hydrolase, partial [Arthrobacter sp.]